MSRCNDPSCTFCKAYVGNGVCELGYSVDREREVPEEDCPRPLTYLALLEQREERSCPS